jgi:hypothetical protein
VAEDSDDALRDRLDFVCSGHGLKRTKNFPLAAATTADNCDEPADNGAEICSEEQSRSSFFGSGIFQVAGIQLNIQVNLQVFEEDRYYDQVFNKDRLRVDLRCVVLRYKVQWRLTKLMRAIEQKAISKYFLISRARHLYGPYCAKRFSMIGG